MIRCSRSVSPSWVILPVLVSLAVGLCGCGKKPAVSQSEGQSNDPGVEAGDETPNGDSSTGSPETNDTEVTPTGNAVADPTLSNLNEPAENGQTLSVGALQLKIDKTNTDIWKTLQQAQTEPIDHRLVRQRVTSLVSQQLGYADQILQLSDLNRTQRLDAIRTKLECLGSLANQGPEQVNEWRNYSLELSKDADKEVAEIGEITLFSIKVQDLIQEKLKDPAVVERALEPWLTPEKLTLKNFTDLRLVLGTSLVQSQFNELGLKLLTRLARAASELSDPNMVEEAQQLLSELRRSEFDQFVFDVKQGTPGAEDKLFAEVEKFISESPDARRFGDLVNYEYNFERGGNFELAKKLNQAISTGFQAGDDEGLAKQATTFVDNANKRMSLVGQTLDLTGADVNGEPVDLANYRGKYVLVNFWASFPHCLAEIGFLAELHTRYSPHGFDILGINLDRQNQSTIRFLKERQLPWTNILSKPSSEDETTTDELAARDPNAQQCGVTLGIVPFSLLIDKDGKVVSIHTFGVALDKQLATLFPNAEQSPAPKLDGPAPETPQADPTPATPKTSFVPTEFYFVSLDEDGEESATKANADGADSADDAADAEETDGEEQEEDSNPYLPPEDLSILDLIDFLLDMKEKPASIRERPGFTDAVVVAAERVMAGTTKDKFQIIAALEKFAALHSDASLGDKAADKRLMEFVAEMAKDTRPKIAAEVAFYQLERRALEADDLDLKDVPSLLQELSEYFADAELGAQHLRIASATVHAINRLEDGDEREEYFSKFGEQFLTSAHKPLARYGKKLAKGSSGGGKASDLVGKELELTGTTARGLNFDWTAYRGKVVIIDFWATWCGPCRREMPHVKELYNELKKESFEVVGVSIDEDLEALGKYIKDNEIPWENLSGEGAQEAASKYGVRAIPTMMLIDANGKVVATAHNIQALAPKAKELVAKLKE